MADNSESNSRLFGVASLAQAENVDPFAANDNKSIVDPFWDFAGVKGIQTRWNKLYPYQFMILERKEGKWFSSGGETFTLPIPPQALSISTPFAISTAVTMGGIVEEHNGAPLRTITLSGTTGVTPLRGHTEERQNRTVLQGIFGGTVDAAGTLGQAVGGVTRAIPFLTGNAEQVNLLKDSDFESGGSQDLGTGFAQYLLLQRFLEAYAALKKTAAGKNKTLAFAIWKEQAVYLVTPVSFDVTRNSEEALSYRYNISLRAWKRVTLADSSTQPIGQYTPPAFSPNKFAQVLNALTQGRRILQQTKNLLKAFQGDIELDLLTGLRQSILFCKDSLGVAAACVDLPNDIVSDMKEPILEAVGTQFDTNSFQSRTLLPGNRGIVSDKVKSSFEDLARLAVEKNKGVMGAANASSNDFSRGSQNSNKAAPAHKIFEEIENNFDLFEKIKITDLTLRPHTIKKIEEERRRVRNLKREDFEAIRDNTLNLLNDFCNAVGAGSSTYNRTVGAPTVGALREATDEDWELIYSLSSTAQAFDALAASATINKNEIDAISYIAGLATRSGIAFRIPRSKYLVPFLYGHTLEQLAARYLGDPDRWMEIAALNGLQEPFVDEVGFSASLLANGNGNQVTVADGSRYFVNQPVWIRSLSQREEQRRIVKVEVLSPVLTVLTLSGDADLEKYTTLAQAVVNAFLPNTVNSRQLIYIPSEDPTDDQDFRTKDIPGVDYFDPLIRSGGIDLLLTADGDLVITPDGTTRLAVGLTNIIQRVRIAFGTLKGSLLRHPSFGLAVKPGTSTADVSAQDLLQQAKSMFRDDPAFAGIEYAAVLKNENYVKMTVAVRLAGIQKTIPITVDVRR